MVQGVKSFTQACEYNGHDEVYQAKLKELSDQLTPEQTQRVRDLLQVRSSRKRLLSSPCPLFLSTFGERS